MITTVAASVAFAMGAVLASNYEPVRLCHSGTASNPVCCGLDVIGAVSVDCATREFLLGSTWNQRRSLIHIALLTAQGPTPQDIPDFKKICASTGQQAKCCLLVAVRNFYSMLVDTVFTSDST
jgi:hypothetical protein